MEKETTLVNKDKKVIIIAVLLALVLFVAGFYSTLVNQEILFHRGNIIAHTINPIREKCVSDGGKYITGWVGGYPSYLCVPG